MDNLNFNNLIQIEDNLYCVNDIAEKLILSKNVKEYIKKINNKKWIKGNYYISKDDMIVILSKCKTDIGKQYLNFIIGSDKPIEKDTTKHITTKEELQAKVDNRKFIDHGTNEIIYNNSKIIFFEYNEILYLKAKDVCDLLEYSNSRREIELHVDKEDIFIFDSFIGSNSSKTRLSLPNNIEGNEGCNKLLHPLLPHEDTHEYINELPQKTNKDIEQLKKIKLMIEQKTNKFIDPKTVFINESGLYSLILSSKMPEAKKFKHWVTNDVLVSIRKTGSYNRVHNGLLYDEVKLR
jgi:prophage antirepressor-like protein